MNLSSHVPTTSSSAISPIASKRSWILTATEKPDSMLRRNSKSDTASSSQARLQDAYFGGLMDTATEKLVAAKEESGDADLSESITGSEEDVTGRPVAFQKDKGKPCAPSKSDHWKNRMVTQSIHVSSHSSSYGSSLLDRQENLRTRTWRPCGWSGCENGQIPEYRSSISSSFWTRLWGEFTIREESPLE